MKSKRFLSEVDLNHNSNPLFRLIDEPNESEVFVDGEKVTALIDSGAKISSITTSLAKALKLEVQSIKTILDLAGTRDLLVPYLRYVEMQLKIPEVKAFDWYILMLVDLDSPYCERVPIALGTLHIDMLIKLATQEELEIISHCWKRGAVITRIAMCQMQLPNKVSLIDQINSDIELPQNVTIKPFETIKTIGISKIPNHEKCINVVIELSPVDRQGNEVNTVPSYDFETRV